MKAVVFEKNNTSEPLVIRELEKPIPGENEVLVKIAAAAVNAADYRSIKLGIIPKRKILGADIAGCIEAVGGNANKLKVGDEVFGDIASCGFGGFAEYVSVPENALVLKPMKIPFEIAAAVPMASMTALQALRNLGNIQSDKKVLIYGAGGGVGTFAVQIAKNFGAEVTAVCGSNNKKLVQSLGADDVINYDEEDIFKSGKRFDLILAVNGNRSLTAYRRLMEPKGICVMIGGALSQIFRMMLFGKILSAGHKKLQLLKAKLNPKDLEFIIELVEEGKITPVIDRVYPLDETNKAVKYLSEGHAQGKVVIKIS